MQKIREAMLLAAGFSTRMRPLTNDIPKPLLGFWDVRQLDITLAYLKQNGIESVATNVHHGREKYIAAIKDPKLPFQIEAFVETPEIFGTGGGIKNMRPFVKDNTFAVVNCDFVTDVDLQKAAEFHQKKKSIATMVLIDDPRMDRYGKIGVDSEGKIIDFPHGKCPGGAKSYGFFSGIHIFDQKIFDEMPDERVFCINRDVYSKVVERGGPAFGFIAKNRWYDTGEIKEYNEAQVELRAKPFAWMIPAKIS